MTCNRNFFVLQKINIKSVELQPINDQILIGLLPLWCSYRLQVTVSVKIRLVRSKSPVLSIGVQRVRTI